MGSISHPIVSHERSSFLDQLTPCKTFTITNQKLSGTTCLSVRPDKGRGKSCLTVLLYIKIFTWKTGRMPQHSSPSQSRITTYYYFGTSMVTQTAIQGCRHSSWEEYRYSTASQWVNDFFVQMVSICDTTPPWIKPPSASKLIFFDPLTFEQVIKLLTSSIKKCCRLNSVPTFLVKKEVASVAPVIVFPINKSLESGIFSRVLQVSCHNAPPQESLTRSRRTLSS